MNSFMHKSIKRFKLTGKISDDKYIPRIKEEYIKLICESMRYQGYVQRIDIDPDWSISYTGNCYEFVLSVYGLYVGKRNALCIQGIDKNKPIFIPQNKLEASLQTQA